MKVKVKKIPTQNAAKWRHELGGYLLPKYQSGGELTTNVPNKFEGFMKGAGIVGSIIGMGDQIAQPIRQGADMTNSAGGLVNETKSANAATAGAFFDPLRTGISTMREGNTAEKQEYFKLLGKSLLGVPFLGGKGFGKARAKRLDEEGEAEMRQQVSQAATNNYINALNTQLRTYAYGGNMYGKGIVDYKGATHAQGGIKVDSNGNPTSVTGRKAIAELETGEVSWSGYVFSNKISYGKK